MFAVITRPGVCHMLIAACEHFMLFAMALSVLPLCSTAHLKRSSAVIGPWFESMPRL
jgi:hypothetical protein